MTDYHAMSLILRAFGRRPPLHGGLDVRSLAVHAGLTEEATRGALPALEERKYVVNSAGQYTLLPAAREIAGRNAGQLLALDLLRWLLTGPRNSPIEGVPAEYLEQGAYFEVAVADLEGAGAVRVIRNRGRPHELHALPGASVYEFGDRRLEELRRAETVSNDQVSETRPRLTRSRDQVEGLLDVQIRAGALLRSEEPRSKERFDDLSGRFDEWDDYNEEALRSCFTVSKIADEYRASGGVVIGPRATAWSLPNHVESLRESIDRAVQRLRSIKGRLEFFDEPPTVAAPSRGSHGAAPTPDGGKVFLVHGHDEAAKQTVARFLEKVGVEVVILHEQASRGDTVIEKLARHGDVGFAVVLLTSDDVGGPKSGEQKPRARQNVVLELGYFVGRLGRDHVCALYAAGVELPSDMNGVVYVALSGNDWKLEFAKELRAAGMTIDLNRAV